MTMLTFNYKKHHIHCKTEGNSEHVQVQLSDHPEQTFSTFKLYTVKSVQAAKLFITKHVKSTK